MNIKVFNIRLNKEHCQEDQNRMNEFLDSVEIKLTSTNFVTTGTVDFWSAVVFYEPKKENKFIVDESELSLDEKKIYSALKQWRNDLAKESGWSAFRICHNSHLISITKIKPQTLDELKNIRSFGERRTLNYGDDIISLLNAL
ncbi:MAG: HRDC domain-containing protein [Flavobacterium sp.]|uniref:HRDC domain-containing protein n=1 Tax=Flavobacterium sp. TaxID=239 RepID=UPI00261E3941|nr:HRDC domain-containing protein [Flavobacterium sp.]MDD5150949.1 HRDC domain-containing protein [Flavobacterium sp.]